MLIIISIKVIKKQNKFSLGKGKESFEFYDLYFGTINKLAMFIKTKLSNKL